MNKKEKKYTITNISAKQLRMIQKSLDLYARLGILQYEYVPLDELTWGSKFSNSYHKNRDEIEFLLQKAKQLMVSELEEYKEYNVGHWSLGIANPDVPKSCQSCYEMSSLIQDLFAMEGGGHVKGKLDLTGEEDIIVRDADMRIEKIMKLLEKYNQSKI
jgi:hypothetical protein